MKHLTYSLSIALAILLIVISCKTCPKVTDDPVYIQVMEQNSTLKAKNDSLVSKVDSLINLPLYDSLTDCIYNYNYLKGSWDMLVDMFDSVCSIKPDTITLLPKCTLCYKDTVNINGIQYYVGYDGKQYKLFQEEDTIIRQVFFKDTTVIRYFIKDSIVGPVEKALIAIEASGYKCNGNWPFISIEVNGSFYRNINLSSQLNEYYFNVLKHEYDIDSIRVSFNKNCDPITDTDSNCYISSVTINSHKYLLKGNTILYKNAWYEDNSDNIIIGDEGSILIETYKTNDTYYSE